MPRRARHTGNVERRPWPRKTDDRRGAGQEYFQKEIEMSNSDAAVHRFQRLASEISDELHNARSNLYILEALQSTDVKVLNQYHMFFRPTMWAHMSMLAIRLHTLVDKDDRVPSISSALAMLEDNTLLAKGVDVQGLKARLRNLEPVLNRITRFRNQRAAHREYEVTPPPLRTKEIRSVYEELVVIFKESCQAPNDITY